MNDELLNKIIDTQRSINQDYLEMMIALENRIKRIEDKLKIKNA